MTPDDQDLLDDKLRMHFQAGWRSSRNASEVFWLLSSVTELSPSITWSETSGMWEIKMDGAQTQYVEKAGLLVGICKAIVAALRL